MNNKKDINIIDILKEQLEPEYTIERNGKDIMRIERISDRVGFTCGVSSTQKLYDSYDGVDGCPEWIRDFILSMIKEVEELMLEDKEERG
jgi:hypothetical protein